MVTGLRKTGAAEPAILFGACRDPKHAALLKSAGYDFVEANVASLLMPDKPDAEWETAMAALGTSALPIRSCSGFYPESIPLVGPAVDMEAVLRHAGAVFRRAKTLGIPYIVLGSGRSRRVPDGFDAAKARAQFIDACKRMAPLAADGDVVVVLEPLNKSETNFLNRVDEGVPWVDEIGHPNIQLLADIYHMLQDDEGPDSIRLAGARIRHTHIAEKGGRTIPGTVGDDFRPYFKALKAAGYTGGVSIEGRWAKSNWEEQLAPALAVMREQFASA